MAEILRVISKDQKQFERFKAASKLYTQDKDLMHYRVTKPQNLDLLASNVTKIVILPKGFDCMKAWEEKELRSKAARMGIRFYSLTEKKFKEFEKGPIVPVKTLGNMIEELAESEGGD